MTEATVQTVTADILAIKVQGYAERSAAQQLGLRDRLDVFLAAAIAHVAPADRIVAETADGVAVVFLGAPGDALRTATALRAGRDGGAFKTVLPIGAGLDRGPVKLDTADGTMGVAGDGIAGAETLAALAESGQIVVSRDFRDAAAQGESFRPLGTRTDGTVGAPEMFLFDPVAGNVDVAPPRGLSIRRRALLTASSAAVLLLASGFAAREVIEAKRRPGVIRFAVRPTADVLVDSAYKGMTPPVQAIRVPPGRHTVELKRAGQPTRNVQVDLQPGEEVEIRHTFYEKPRPKTFWERLGL